MLGHDAVAQALVDEGVDTVFGVLGDGNLFIGEALVRIHDVNYISATHEANAVSMAEGWSKATGRVGVAPCTHRPRLPLSPPSATTFFNFYPPTLFIFFSVQ